MIVDPLTQNNSAFLIQDEAFSDEVWQDERRSRSRRSRRPRIRRSSRTRAPRRKRRMARTRRPTKRPAAPLRHHRPKWRSKRTRHIPYPVYIQTPPPYVPQQGSGGYPPPLATMQQPRQGSEIIRWAQSTLNLVLRLNLLVDGFMRPETRRAVRTFQRQKRLILDGIVGPSTKTALVAARQRYLPTRNKQNEFEEESFLDAVWDGFKKTARRSTPSNQALRNNIVKITRQEWERWQHGKVKEGSLRMRPILETYWRKGAGWLPKKEKWWSRAPWSAAFISWVMRKAGAGSDFRYSAAHATYVAAARENRLAKNSNPFKAYRISEVAPQPGDLVCKRRQKGVTYDNVRRGHRTHCDVVVSVKPGWIQTIGGNVSHSVKMTKVAVDGNGRVTDSRYFAIVKVG